MSLRPCSSSQRAWQPARRQAATPNPIPSALLAEACRPMPTWTETHCKELIRWVWRTVAGNRHPTSERCGFPRTRPGSRGLWLGQRLRTELWRHACGQHHQCRQVLPLQSQLPGGQTRSDRRSHGVHDLRWSRVVRSESEGRSSTSVASRSGRQRLRQSVGIRNPDLLRNGVQPVSTGRPATRLLEGDLRETKTRHLECRAGSRIDRGRALAVAHAPDRFLPGQRWALELSAIGLRVRLSDRNPSRSFSAPPPPHSRTPSTPPARTPATPRQRSTARSPPPRRGQPASSARRSRR